MPELIHTCYRISNIDRSVDFYERLGFEELGRMPIRDEATNVFMGLPGDGARLELTVNDGRTEPYEVGEGYGHIAIVSADGADAEIARMAEHGIAPEKEPYAPYPGGPKIFFVRDPDGYRIEFLERNPEAEL
jgi:lactoylglutathione lyase